MPKKTFHILSQIVSSNFTFSIVTTKNLFQGLDPAVIYFYKYLFTRKHKLINVKSAVFFSLFSIRRGYWIWLDQINRCGAKVLASLLSDTVLEAV